MVKLDLQRLILQLIVEQYLKEDFHFTSYATTCYLKPGPRAEYIKNEKCQILLDIVENAKRPTLTTNKKRAKQIVDKKPSTTTVTEDRPKLQMVTNTEPVVRPIRRKRRILEYEDDEDDDGNDAKNIPILKKANTSSNDNMDAF
ncbi:unnamed protein product [Rotaria magnacalcarata]|nr:unnamed protein product [Rotaria magnacalcarata]